VCLRVFACVCVCLRVLRVGAYWLHIGMRCTLEDWAVIIVNKVQTHFHNCKCNYDCSHCTTNVYT